MPCDDSICGEHLSERDVLNESIIKCNECKEDFQIKENEFKSNNELEKLIESQSYLNDEESSRKQEIEVSVRKFIQFYDEFSQNRKQLESDLFNHLVKRCAFK